MKPADLLIGAARVRDAVVACDLLRRFNEFTAARWQSRPDPAGLLTCYGGFTAQLGTFGEAERSILQALDLEMLMDAGWWTRLLLEAAEQEPAQALLTEIAAIKTRVNFLLSTLPKLLTALGPMDTTPSDPARSLTLRLATQVDQVSQPRRLSQGIEAISLLWEVMSELTGAALPLTLISSTPGPDAALVFQGDEVLMTPLKGVLLNLWEHVVSLHSLTIRERAEQIPPMLPLMQRIDTSGVIDAATLRAKAMEGVRLFLQTGASIPEMDDMARFSPARLLHPSETLVVRTDPGRMIEHEKAPISLTPPAASVTTDELEALIAEERDFLLKEAQRKKVQDRAPRSWVSKRPTE